MIKIINSNKSRKINEIELKKGKNEVEFESQSDFNEWLIYATGFIICEAITFDDDKVSTYIPENEIDDNSLE